MAAEFDNPQCDIAGRKRLRPADKSEYINKVEDALRAVCSISTPEERYTLLRRRHASVFDEVPPVLERMRAEEGKTTWNALQRKKYTKATKLTVEIERGETTGSVLKTKGTFVVTVKPKPQEQCVLHDFVLQILSDDPAVTVSMMNDEGEKVQLEHPAEGAGWRVFSMNWDYPAGNEIHLLVQTSKPNTKFGVAPKGRIR
ncbi:MAG: hypothetical protein HY540_00685 [Deltaproteobacteria bacterium]|nr:hypothetical protein [Deltaproteobacteria bacterium]